MGDKKETWNLTSWPASLTLHQPDPTSFWGGNNSTNETTIGFGGSIMLKTLAQQQNSTTRKYPMEARTAYDDGQSGLINILASILMIFSIISNADLLLVTTIRILRMKKNRVTHLFLWSLGVADILVSTMLLPFQVGLIRTNPWKEGEMASRTIIAFFRSFSYYLYGLIVMCISADQYLLVYRSFLIKSSVCRSMLMLSVAWVASVCCGLPEAVLYHVCSSPKEPQFMDYTRTSPYSYVSAAAYFLHAMIKAALDVFPFVVVITCYFRILRTMYRTRREGIRGSSGNDLLGWKQRQILKMFIAIGLAFLLCRIPSTVITFWFWVDPESAFMINPGVRMAIILFSYIGPCVNPFLYGYFH